MSSLLRPILQCCAVGIVIAATAPVLASTAAEHSALLQAIEDAAFTDDQLAVLRSHSGQSFSTDQAKELIDLFMQDDDKLKALALIVGGVQAGNTDLILSVFMMDDAKDKAKTLLSGTAPSHHAVSPTTTPGGANACAALALSQGSGRSEGYMSAERFSKMQAQVNAETFKDKRMKALKTFLHLAPEGLSPAQAMAMIKWFTYKDDKISVLEQIEDRITGMSTAQMKTLIALYPYRDDKMRVLELLKDTILDVEKRFDVVQAFTYSNDKKNARKLLEGIKGRTYLWGTIRARRVLFVVDTSGSMSARGKWPKGGAGTRMDFVKKELREAIAGHLPNGVRFNIISFEGRVKSWHEGLVLSSPASRKKALTFVEGMRAYGGTNIYDSLQQAFATQGVEAIYLLTDGEPSAGKSTNTATIRQAVLGWNKSKGIVLNTVAMLTGGGKSIADRRARAFMFELAQQNCGQFRLVQ